MCGDGLIEHERFKMLYPSERFRQLGDAGDQGPGAHKNWIIFALSTTAVTYFMKL